MSLIRAPDSSFNDANSFDELEEVVTGLMLCREALSGYAATQDHDTSVTPTNEKPPPLGSLRQGLKCAVTQEETGWPVALPSERYLGMPDKILTIKGATTHSVKVVVRP